MKRFALIAAICAASTATAKDIDGIQNHHVQKLFMQRPCFAVIDQIDNPEKSALGAGRMAMAFGFLMGIEALHPGIRGGHESILRRLRADCTQATTKTALEILLEYDHR